MTEQPLLRPDDVLTATGQIDNFRVLVIDDSEAIHDDFRKVLAPVSCEAGLASLEDQLFGDTASTPLQHRFEVDSALQGEKGVERVRLACDQNRPYAVAFVDMRMPPGWDGLQTVKAIWQVDREINIVVCTAFSDHSWADIEQLAGWEDRLLVLKKPFEPIEVRRLAATLTAKWTLARRAALKTSELEQIVSQRTTELHHAATHDRLTGLPNRMLFLERLTQALALARRRSEYRLAVLFLDFDRFKLVNDSLGHEAGDRLLCAIGKRLSHLLRGNDTVSFDAATSTTARLGGDEFCVLLCGLARDGDAALVAERILHALETPFELEAGAPLVHSSASIGIAVAAAGHGTAEDMIRDADTAMYRAKAEGPGRFMLFDRAMHEAAVTRLATENELRRALAAEDELQVYFQPIVSLETGRLTGAEALVRWNHPRRGLIPPGEFIPIAEESGLIHRLGQRMLEHCCRQLSTWQRRAGGTLDITVSVNASPQELDGADFTARLQQIIANTGVDPRRLVLEMTESALVRDPQKITAVLEQIHAAGIRVYLDDFGTGYSSLSLLHTFPLDGLKVDRSFVWAAVGNGRRTAVLRAITELAHHLNMEMVAEGIEQPAQVELLRSLRCVKGQGYLFAKPMPAAEFENMLFEHASSVWPRTIAA